MMMVYFFEFRNSLDLYSLILYYYYYYYYIIIIRRDVGGVLF